VEAIPSAPRPLCFGDNSRVRWKVVAEDELADPYALSDAPNLGDVGMQRGHPGQLGVVGAVPLEVVQVGDLMDEDVGPRARVIGSSFTVVSPENATDPPGVSNR
jgi:hypothetical protein